MMLQLYSLQGSTHQSWSPSGPWIPDSHIRTKITTGLSAMDEPGQ